MNTENFTIDNSDIEFAQDICKLIADDDVRSRAVANAIASTIAEKYFDVDIYNIDTVSGLHKIGLVLQDIDISDIYINDAYIDVRVFFNEEEIVVPTEHFENNLLPVAYMFIKITPDLSQASVVGFLAARDIGKETPVVGEYYKIEESELVSFYDIEPLLSEFVDESVNIEDKDIFSYIDNTLDDKISFYAKLLKAKNGRIRLAKATKAQSILKYVSVCPNTNDKKEDSSDEGELLLINELNDYSNSEYEINLTNNTIVNGDNADEIQTEYNEELLEDEYPKGDTEELSIGDISIKSYEAPISETVTELSIEDLECSPEDSTEDKDTDFAVDSDSTNQEINPNSDNDSTKANIVIPEYSDNFAYKTVASPSDNSFADEFLDKNLETDAFESASSEVSDKDSDEQIKTLFDTAENEQDKASPGIKVYAKNQNKKNAPVKTLFILTLLILAGAAGYTGYTKFLSTTPSEDKINSTKPETKQMNATPSAKQVDAMPIETVDTNVVTEDNDEAISTSIPAIEQNLDASILVSNLKVDWEVPAGYASNTAAKRYLVKLGKIIQLNLKTELLLLNKPPITNKIAVELKYNTNSRKFEASGVTISSGEKSVDDLILQTVNRALAMNLSTNTDSFAKLQGNPILIIHL